MKHSIKQQIRAVKNSMYDLDRMIKRAGEKDTDPETIADYRSQYTALEDVIKTLQAVRQQQLATSALASIPND